MRIKYLLIGLAAVSLLSGCGKKVEFEGEPWYANTERENKETDIDKEYSSDSMAESWEYGSSPEAGHDLAEDEEYYYMPNPTDQRKLYRIRKDDGFAKEKLLDVSVGDVNVVQDRIYFSNQDENALKGIGIYSIDVQGGEPEILTDHYPRVMQVVNDWLYFIDYNDDCLYKVHSKSRELLQLAEKCSGLYLNQNEIYTWIEAADGDEESGDSEYELISMDVNGNKIHSYGKDGLSFTAGEGCLYIYREDGLWKVSMEDPEQQELITDELEYANRLEVVGDEIYYITGLKQLARYTISSGENKIYTSISYVTGYDIFDGMIAVYYQSGTNRNISVNQLSDGTPVAFFE